MSDKVLVPLPSGQWLALAPEVFAEALRLGQEVIATPKQPDAADAERLVDGEELAQALNLPVTWLEQAAREGRIPSIQAGRWRRFRRSNVERSLAANGKLA